MNTCDYVDPRGIQYDDDLFSHVIYNNSLCVQSDDEKTGVNQHDLGKASELPIYCVFAHGKIISDVHIDVDDDFAYHVTSSSAAFFNLQQRQYVYDLSPVGSLLKCTNKLNEYTKFVIDNPDGFLQTIFSPNFKLASSPTAESEHELESALFSPPLFTTINKTLDFYEDVERSPLRFGVIQLNKPTMNEEAVRFLSSIGTTLVTRTDEDKMRRCINLAVSEYGKLTNNPEAERQFVETLTRQHYRCSLEQVVSTFGPGIYIMSTCSPLLLNITGAGLGQTVPYSSEEGIKKPLKNPAQREIIDKAVYAFNNDLERIVYSLNYRWMEMVQHVQEVASDITIPQVDVRRSGQYEDYSSPMFERLHAEDEDETATQPDDEIAILPDEYTGGASKRKRRQQKKTKRRQQKKTKRRQQKTSNRRPTRAHRRSKYYPSRV
jgi:hypothetical protein